MSVQDLFSLKGKTALVTGGTRGIGFMIARAFVEAGVKTYITSRKADACARAEAELGKHGTCIAVPCDLGDGSQLKRLADDIKSRESKLDILINNAGATWGAPVETFPEDAWDKVMNLNVKAVFFLTRELLPLLRRAATRDDPARVVNIGSVDGIIVSGMDNYAYSASKAAVHHLSRVLARALAKDHVTVNAVAPGPFETKMIQFALDADRGAVEGLTALGSVGGHEDAAGVAIYLCSRAGANVTGVVLPVDGGMSGAVSAAGPAPR